MKSHGDSDYLVFILELLGVVGEGEATGADVTDVLGDTEGGGGVLGVPEEQDTSRLPGWKQYIWPAVSSILM